MLEPYLSSGVGDDKLHLIACNTLTAAMRAICCRSVQCPVRKDIEVKYES